jgi:hypothetical protein
MNKYWLATWMHAKRYDHSQFRDCDNGSDLTEAQRNEVFDLVDEIDAIGLVEFRKKYAEHKLFP